MKKLLIAVALIACAGCARFQTTQHDTSYDENGKPARAITTKASAYTLFDSTSALSSFKASQTDKTQSAEVGALNQSATTTNLAPNIEAAVELIKALK